MWGLKFYPLSTNHYPLRRASPKTGKNEKSETENKELTVANFIITIVINTAGFPLVSPPSCQKLRRPCFLVKIVRPHLRICNVHPVCLIDLPQRGHALHPHRNHPILILQYPL